MFFISKAYALSNKASPQQSSSQTSTSTPDDSQSRSRRSSHTANWFPEDQHPDLPLSPSHTGRPTPSSKNSSSAAAASNTTAGPGTTLRRSPTVRERADTRPLSDRRSIAITPEPTSAYYNPSTDSADPSPSLAGGLSRSQTVLRRDGSGTRSSRNASNRNSVTEYSQISSSSAQYADFTPPWSPNDLLPTPEERDSQELYFSAPPPPLPSINYPPPRSASMSADRKLSQDSNPNLALDRWSQRRLQRLNTEQGFREQRQGGQGVLSPPLNSNAASLSTSSSGGSEHTAYSTAGSQYTNSSADAQPQSVHHPQPQQVGYQSRTAQQPNVGLGLQTQQPPANPSRAQHYPPPQESQSHVQQYSPESASYDAGRPPLNQSRSFSQHATTEDTSSMSNNGPLPAPKATRPGNGNRQSVHNGLASRDGSHSTQGGQIPAFNASIVPPAGQSQPHNKTSANQQSQQQQQQQAEAGRGTPQPIQIAGEDMSPEDVETLVKEHKELREKYTKVKKYYFEKEDQVKQLQNSLAHQRLSQSRTSLDDSEYTTRFNRLDGLIAQLAFSIRKSWKSIPQWLVNSVNRDAVNTGKQEMTAAGRAFISCWLVEEVFDRYFHPDLEPSFSAQLKNLQRNIRKYAPIAQTAEEEEYLTSKVVNWRLATLEGLQEALRLPSCPDNRQKLTDTLKDNLVSALALHLQDPPPSDLEGGVHMIIELVVSIAIHLPLESRDVVIEYYMPGYSIMPDQMKVETGIPALVTSVAEDTAERASMKSATSDVTDMTEGSNAEQPSKKRSMLSALTGSGNKHKAQGKHAAAGGSSSSLNRPESSQGMKEDSPPRVRMAAGIGVSVRGRTVLVKAPVFST